MFKIYLRFVIWNLSFRIIGWLLVVSCWLLVAAPTQAVGVGVRPQEIELKGRVAEMITARLWVTNASSVPGLFTVTADSLSSWFQIRPSAFNLAGRAAQEVTVSVLPETDGAFATFLSLVASPISRDEVKAGTGIKIPVTLSIRAGQPWYQHAGSMVTVILVMIAVALLAFWFGWQYHRERKLNFLQKEERKLLKWLRK